ncbi:hypothetical protein ZIOFF_052848 [Zingiber officinale]|uniref:Uncharacterized protein n=1 Tax=Zingiber officinale TaxID=94328 RepID=A0A8J5FD23_ZINOF|nr:hypothetical protein ZIOFF_052848 [Zingiber officinale]
MERQQTTPTTATTVTLLFEDQIREYRRNQRKLYNTRKAAQRLGRRLTGRASPSYTLEQQLDPQAQLQALMIERASIVPAEVLYHSRRDDEHHWVYLHRSEEPLLMINSNQADRNFIQEESFMQLRRSRMQYIHIGILQVRIQTLHRQEEGVLALIVFRDNRWLGDQAILATMEIDLTRGSRMVGMVGRLSNTPNVDFAYEIQGVVDYLTSHGVNALPGRRYPTTPLLGLDWVIKPTQLCILMQPMEGHGGYN